LEEAAQEIRRIVQNSPQFAALVNQLATMEPKVAEKTLGKIIPPKGFDVDARATIARCAGNTFVAAKRRSRLSSSTPHKSVFLVGM
jgi:hypothetical protein